MKIFFSGSGGTTSPEFLISHRKPNVMLTFHQLHVNPKGNGWAGSRLRRHLRRKGFGHGKQIKELFNFLEEHKEKKPKKEKKKK